MPSSGRRMHCEIPIAAQPNLARMPRRQNNNDNRKKKSINQSINRISSEMSEAAALKQNQCQSQYQSVC